MGPGRNSEDFILNGWACPGRYAWAVGLGLDWFPGSEIGSEKIRAQVFIMACGSCNSYKISFFSSAIFLPWLSGEFSLFPSRRLVEISMKDDSIMAKVGHHKELFANYWFFVAKTENQIIDFFVFYPPNREHKISKISAAIF